MKSATHKVLHKVGGLAMIHHVLSGLAAAAPQAQRLLVVGDRKAQLAAALPDEAMIEQTEQLGTGHAVQICKDALADQDHGDILVLFGDTPLIPADVITRMLAAKADRPDTGVVVLGFDAADPARYGRLVVNETGGIDRIVEYKDATAAERAITLCNSGVMLVDGARCFNWLERLTNDNAAGEYYLTDVVALARADGAEVALVTANEDDVIGVNSRADLAAVEAVFQARKRQAVMDAGVTLQAPESVFFSHDTDIGEDCVIEPHVVFGTGVRVAAGVTVKAFSHLEGAHVATGASVGPYARLRPGTMVGEDAKIGNFVETKKTTLAAGAKVSHLTYLGDATVGAAANIGAGTITCNYDGYDKFRTEIGAGAFIGSNSALVAPVRIGAGAIVGAGSTITGDVAADALALTRAEQQSREGAAKRFRDKKNKG